MPRQQQPDSAESIALNQILDEDDAALKRVSEQMGPPHGSVKQSQADEVKRWGQLDPRVDRDLMPQQLMATGLPPEQAKELAILQEYPDLLPLYTQPIGDPQMADLLTRFAEMPYRWSLLEGIDDPEERAAKAESLDRAHEKALAARMQQQRAGLGSSIRSAMGGLRAATPAPEVTVRPEAAAQPLPGPAQGGMEAAGPAPAAGLLQGVGQPPAGVSLPMPPTMGG